MDQALQEIQTKLDLLYAKLEAVSVELDKHPTADLMKRMEVLDAEIDLAIDQLLDAEKQMDSNKAQG